PSLYRIPRSFRSPSASRLDPMNPARVPARLWPFGRFQTTHKLPRIDFTRRKQRALERQRLELSDYDADQIARFVFPIGGPIEQRTQADAKSFPETQARRAHRVVERRIAAARDD